MIKYEFIKVGIPSTDLKRMSFFNQVSFNVGGDVLSFNELENGIMRANAKPPYQLSRTFNPRDTKNRLIVKTFNSRIHFALNCGAKSCPPVKKFTVAGLDEELRIAAEAFAEQDENVKVIEENHELYLNRIFKWYKVDFGNSLSSLPCYILKLLRGKKKESLQRMINKKTKISVKFFPYNWGTNSERNKTYAGVRRPEAISIKALLPF